MHAQAACSSTQGRQVHAARLQPLGVAWQHDRGLQAGSKFWRCCSRQQCASHQHMIPPVPLPHRRWRRRWRHLPRRWRRTAGCPPLQRRALGGPLPRSDPVCSTKTTPAFRGVGRCWLATAGSGACICSSAGGWRQPAHMQSRVRHRCICESQSRHCSSSCKSAL